MTTASGPARHPASRHSGPRHSASHRAASHRAASHRPGARLLLVLLLGGLVALFFLLDLGRYLSLDELRARQAELSLLVQARPVLMLLAYSALYIAVTALSLPGAAVLTLAGGALFGFWPALAAISFASSIGATLACLTARYLLRDWVHGRFGERLAKIDHGVREEGAFYLFTLRLVPVFPFFLVNLGMGLTSLPLRTFYWVSQLGMLPGTAVYVNAGRELGRLQHLSDILSPGLLLSFALLGIFPLAARKLAQALRKGRSRAASHPDE